MFFSLSCIALDHSATALTSLSASLTTNLLQVRLAQKWKTVPEQKKCSRSAEKINLIIPGKNRNKATLEVKDCDEVTNLAEVQDSVINGNVLASFRFPLFCFQTT